MKAYLVGLMMLAVPPMWGMSCEKSEPGLTDAQASYEIKQRISASKRKLDRSCCLCGLVVYAVSKINSTGRMNLLYPLLRKGFRAHGKKNR